MDEIKSENIRDKLTSLILGREDWIDKLEGLGSIRKIFDNNVFPEGTDCTSILFGEIQSSILLYKCLATSVAIAKPEPWAIVDYGYPEDGEGVSHVGLITPELKLISKWGQKGHVFENSTEEVPSWWGPVVYRRINNYGLLDGMHPKLREYLDEKGWREVINSNV